MAKAPQVTNRPLPPIDGLTIAVEAHKQLPPLEKPFAAEKPAIARKQRTVAGKGQSEERSHPRKGDVAPRGAAAAAAASQAKIQGQSQNQQTRKQGPEKWTASQKNEPQVTDISGDGEEELEVGMRQNAMERDAADADQDGKLDFDEFCAFVREREEGSPSDADLKARFEKLDEDGSGKVDMHEYLLWSLREALARSSQRVIDVLHAWDEDRNGMVDKREFAKAVRSLGFEVDRADAEAVFDSLDADGSGQLEYKELNVMLRKGAGSEATKSKLKRGPRQADQGRAAACTNKNLNANYNAMRTQALPPLVRLEATSELSVQEQLHDALKTHNVKLIDLFREWDDDGNGALDKKELRQAVAALGFEAPRKEIDALFDSIDDDSSGWIEYEELKDALREKNAKRATKEHAKKTALAGKAAALQDLDEVVAAS